MEKRRGKCCSLTRSSIFSSALFPHHHDDFVCHHQLFESTFCRCSNSERKVERGCQTSQPPATLNHRIQPLSGVNVSCYVRLIGLNFLHLFLGSVAVAHMKIILQEQQKTNQQENGVDFCKYFLSCHLTFRHHS